MSGIAAASAVATAPAHWLQAIILGVVQGITEFLPISSTAHLLIFTKGLGWSELGEKYFVDAIQFGSVLAVMGYFWGDIRQICTGSWAAFQRRDWQAEDWKIFLGIAIGMIPALAGGLAIKLFLPDGALETTQIIGFASILMALLMGTAENIGRRSRGFESLEVRDGILVGLGQMLALIPGASRSGSTLTTALLLGFERDTAARFSFLLGLPTLAIATLYEFKETVKHPELVVPLLIGIVSTFIFSYLSIAWLLNFLKKQSTWVFVWYRLAFGLALILAVFKGLLPNAATP